MGTGVLHLIAAQDALVYARPGLLLLVLVLRSGGQSARVARPAKDASAEKNEHTVQVRARVRGPLTARHAYMADDVEVFQ